MPTSTRTDAPRKRTRQRHAPHLSFRAGAHTGVGIRVPLCRAKGERIAAPVCGLVRNDIFDGVSVCPNHSFTEMPACGSMWPRIFPRGLPRVRSFHTRLASTPTTKCVPLSQIAAILHHLLLPCGGVRSPRPTNVYRYPCQGRTESSAPTTVYRHPL